MSLADELAFTTVAEPAGRIRRFELSPVEVLDATIQRIEQRNPSLNALVFLGFEGARAAAREAEKALTSGAALGPLHGVPAAIKDLFDFKPGWPATFGGGAGHPPRLPLHGPRPRARARRRRRRRDPRPAPPGRAARDAHQLALEGERDERVVSPVGVDTGPDLTDCNRAPMQLLVHRRVMARGNTPERKWAVHGSLVMLGRLEN